MGRHTAPIPIVGATATATATATARTLPLGPVTDPNLFDRPLPIRPAQPPTPAARRRSRAPEPTAPTQEDDGIDETLVTVRPRSVRAVLAAEDAAAAEELPPPPFPRIRDLLFGAASIGVLVVAVSAALLP